MSIRLCGSIRASFSNLNLICSTCSVSRWSSNSAKRVKIPVHPTWSTTDAATLPKPMAVDMELINHLERLSLVEFGNEEGINLLTKGVQFADTLLAVDVEGIEPMTSVIEDRALYLRADEVTEGNNQELLLGLASKTVEDYYVAPPGNIPLTKVKQYNLSETSHSTPDF